MENNMTRFVGQIKEIGSQLIFLYREMQGVLLTWIKTEDPEELKTILEKREKVLLSLESSHAELDRLFQTNGLNTENYLLSIEVLKTQMDAPAYDQISDIYHELTETIVETNELNNKAVQHFEERKNYILDEIVKLNQAKKVTRPYFNEGIVEPRFIDRKK